MCSNGSEKRLKLFDVCLLRFTKNTEKARIEAEMRAAKVAARMRTQAELKQKRETQRLELAKVFCRIL